MQRMTLVKPALAAVVGGLVGTAGWWLGPELGIPVVLGVGTAGGLLALDHLRVSTLRAIGAQRGALARLHALGELQQTADQILRQAARRQDIADAERRLKEAGARDFAQVEALLNLHRLVAVQSAMPATRGWAASPDLLLLLVSLIEQRRPLTVIDLGSGSTTLWMATAMRAYGIEGRVTAFDHEEKYAQLTREALVAHGLEKFAEVRHAPLADIEVDGERWPWYDVNLLAHIEQIDLLVIDGPPGVLRAHARYPALPVLADRLSPDACVVLDDYARPEEKEVVVRWRDGFPGWRLRELPHEKGTALLTRS